VIDPVEGCRVRELLEFRVVQKKLTFFCFKDPAGMRSPGMNGAKTSAREAILPEKGAETMAPTETLSKHTLPAGGNDGFRWKIG
jgi:hypothetical protein